MKGFTRGSPWAARAPGNRSIKPGAGSTWAITRPVEGKLFGIGAESYTVGMHEFYLGYAVKNQKLVCPDAQVIITRRRTLADKVSSVLCFVPEILLYRQPWRALGQRPRRDAHRRAAGHRAGTGAWRLSRSHAHRLGFLRCEHQPHRGVDHRHAQHDPRAVHRHARPHRATQAARTRRRLHLPPRVNGRSPTAAVRRSGITTAQAGRAVGEAWLAEGKRTIIEKNVLSKRHELTNRNPSQPQNQSNLEMKPNRNPYLFAFPMVALLFFVWGFAMRCLTC